MMKGVCSAPSVESMAAKSLRSGEATSSASSCLSHSEETQARTRLSGSLAWPMDGSGITLASWRYGRGGPSEDTGTIIEWPRHNGWAPLGLPSGG